jgi:hypothetical protein
MFGKGGIFQPRDEEDVGGKMTRKWLTLLVISSLLWLPQARIGHAAPAAQDPPPNLYLPLVSQDSMTSVGLRILDNSSTYFDGYSRRHVVGEIENTGERAVKSVIVEADFFDNTGQLADQGRTTLYLRHLNPQDATCFDVYVTEAPGFSRYQVRLIGASTADQAAPGIALTMESIGVDDVTGGFLITGSVRNQETRSIEDVMVVSTLYDGQQKVMDCDYDYAVNAALGPGDSSPFAVYFLKRSLGDYSEMVRYYRLQPDGS